MFDKFREECGLMGVWNVPEAANIAYLGLHAQQHRGQEGAGVVSSGNSEAAENNTFFACRGLGLVGDVFAGYDFNDLPGRNAVGHVRYTTAGSSVLENVQPFSAEISCGTIALAHNGNLVDADQLRADLIGKGSIFSSTSDTEIFLHLISRESNITCENLVETVVQALKQVKGAYSLIIMFKDRLIVVRDPNGFRPLAMATLNDGYVFASETCAFDLIGAEYQRDVKPGELIEITKEGLNSYYPFGKDLSPSPCIFEYVYFARPDSVIYSRGVYAIRKRMGAQLAKEYPAPNADIVIPVPDSGITSALGYSEEAGIPIELGLIRNHYVGRTFIEPTQTIRDFGVKLKLNANASIIKGKSVVVVDDSIVRGTTSKKIVKMIRDAGAKEVHMRISAPPTTNPCYYGIDTPDKHELIASRKTIDEIKAYTGVDSLGYLTIEGLYKAVNQEDSKVSCKSFCDACFTGKYPIKTSCLSNVG